MAELETAERARPVQRLVDDLPLFSALAPRPVARSGGPDPALEALDAVDPDELTPRAALDALYRLKALRRDGAQFSDGSQPSNKRG